VSRTASTILTLTLFGAGAALAQDGGGLRPVDEATPPVEDLGGWLDEGEEPADDPLGLPPESDVVDESEERLSPEERRKRSRVIDRNYREAQETYKDLSRPEHEIRNLERRIANNERIVSEYGQRLADAQEQRRVLQVELFNRTFYLKQQLERGQITQDVFDRLIKEEERQYEQRTRGLERDIQAWQKEVGDARERLDSMKSERRMLQAALPRRRTPRGRQAEAERQPRPGERLIGSLQDRLRQLDRFQVRHTLDRVHPRELGASSVGRVAPTADEAEQEE